MLANILTLLNLQFGFLSIIFSNSRNYDSVYICYIFSALCDFSDGKIARLFKTESKLGSELDTLSDMVSFVVAPSFLGYCKYNFILPTSIYLLSGCYRLARFNISHSNNEFEGVPTPLSTFIITILSYSSLNKQYMFCVYIILSYLMISKIKIVKL